MIAKIKFALLLVGLVLSTSLAAAASLPQGGQALPGQSVPKWVPAPGEVATLTLKNGKLTNSFISNSSKYYSSFHYAKTVNDYSTSYLNPWFGDYGAIIFFGGGHAATNDNSVSAL